MKKLFTIVLFILTFNAYTQVTLETTYPASDRFVNFDYIKTSTIEKIAVSEEDQQIIKVYNINHSLYKTINIPSPSLDAGSSITNVSVQNVSFDLFNTDSKIEYMVEFSTYNSSTSKSGFFVYVYDEDGTVVFSKDSARMVYISGVPGIESGSGLVKMSTGTKLIIQNDKHNDKSVEVYSLPGTLTSSANKQMLYPGLTNPVPNPSGETTRIEFELPQGEDLGEIYVYNMDGIIVKKYLVDNTFNDLLLNNQDLEAGTYMYQLKTAKTASETKKMVIIK